MHQWAYVIMMVADALALNVLCAYSNHHADSVATVGLYEAYYMSYIMQEYCQTFNLSHTLVGNKIVDHSDVVGTLPVGTVPTASSFSI